MSKVLSLHIKKYRSLQPSIVQHALATLATKVHDDTPRDTGAAQNSWELVIGGVKRNPRGGNFISASKGYKAGDEYFVYSALPYIRRLEYGWSRMAPAGMLRINVARWDDIVAHAVRQVGGR